MGSLTAYSGLTTKLRAMRSRLLTDTQFREIVELDNVPAVVGYLRQYPGYQRVFGSLDEQALHRGNVERLLRESAYKDYSKIYSFASAGQRNFLKLYFMRFECHFLKLCLTQIFDHRDVLQDTVRYREFFSHHSELDVDALSSAVTVDELRDRLKDTDYYQPLAALENITNPTLFDYEMALDLFVFKKQWKKKEKLLGKEEAAILEKILGTKFDMLNLQWIRRSKLYYHMTAADIYGLILPVNHKLSRDLIRQMVEAESPEMLEDLIHQSYYGRQAPDYGAETMESLYTAIMKHMLMSASRNDPYSLAMVYCYMYLKEHEVDRLIIALECVRYKVPPDEAMELVNCR